MTTPPTNTSKAREATDRNEQQQSGQRGSRRGAERSRGKDETKTENAQRFSDYFIFFFGLFVSGDHQTASHRRLLCLLRDSCRLRSTLTKPLALTAGSCVPKTDKDPGARIARRGCGYTWKRCRGLVRVGWRGNDIRTLEDGYRRLRRPISEKQRDWWKILLTPSGRSWT